KPIVVDLTAFFSLFAGGADSPTTWRALNAPWYSFSPRDLSTFIAFASRKKGGTLWDAVASCREIPGIGAETIARVEAFISQMRSLAEAARRERPLKILELTLEKTGALRNILTLPEREKIETLGHLNAFANRIKRYEHATLAPTLRGFVEEFREEIASGEEGALPNDADFGPEAVSVMTVHASKGLEFAHVFVVSLVDQRFPTRPRGESIPLPDGLVNERLPEGDTHLEEERRLLYVAMTRAKKSVTLTGAESYGGVRKKKPSVFMNEIGREITRIAQATSGADARELTTPPAIFDASATASADAFLLKRRFSFTQLAAFRKCPLQYKFAHLYRIPILGSYQKSYGQSMHLAFHDILALHVERGKARQGDLFGVGETENGKRETGVGGFRVSIEEAIDIFESRWIDEWYSQRTLHDTYKEEGRAATRRMYERWSQDVPNIIALEQSFDWRIGEHSLKGSVDRIDVLPDSGVAIVDYKTGEPRTADDLDSGDKEQLWIYQLAMEERGHLVKRLSYLYVRTGSSADVPILQEEKREQFKADLLSRMQEILVSRFPASPSPYICRYCDFRNICEFRRL
ncbi:MAG: ATP-dependent DNA helicase, partial [Patescibacteria group bacterium]